MVSTWFNFIFLLRLTYHRLKNKEVSRVSRTFSYFSSIECLTPFSSFLCFFFFSVQGQLYTIGLSGWFCWRSVLDLWGVGVSRRSRYRDRVSTPRDSTHLVIFLGHVRYETGRPLHLSPDRLPSPELPQRCREIQGSFPVSV